MALTGGRSTVTTAMPSLTETLTGSVIGYSAPIGIINLFITWRAMGAATAMHSSKVPQAVHHGAMAFGAYSFDQPRLMLCSQFGGTPQGFLALGREPQRMRAAVVG